MLEQDSDLSDKYCEETDTCHPLADLLEQFQQLTNKFASLKSSTSQSTPTELSQLIDKLQYLTMALQPAPPQSSEELVHKTMQVYTDTLHVTQKESHLTTMLQDIPTFDGQDSSKLEDWFMDIETATDILTESNRCLAEAKSCGLTHTHICEPTQTGKFWDEIKGILRLKLCNANIHTYTSTFMEVQQKDNETLAPTPIASKQQQSDVLV